MDECVYKARIDTVAPRCRQIPIGILALVLGGVALLSGCVVSPGISLRTSHADDAGLFAWVDQELAPYLVDQLSRQPRFRGEPVLLVAMDGADVRTDIDVLSRNIRARLFDRLLHTPGTGMLWRPTADPWEHRRSRGALRCHTASTAHYFVGIDIAPESNRTYRLSVRAFDVGAASWVSGFGKTWRGRLTPAQQKDLADRRTDEYLRGLRVLPFLTGETDLLAAYLAKNLSCLLREQGASGQRVFVAKGAAGKPGLRQVLTLVGHNLARYRTVEVVDDIKHADLQLEGSSNMIDGSLHQLWLTVRARSASAGSTNLNTDAYTYFGGPVVGAAATGWANSHLRAVRSIRGPDPILSRLRVTVAQANESCLDAKYRAPAEDMTIAPGDCFLVEFDLQRSAHLLVLNHAVDGALTRLSQGGCNPKIGRDASTLPRRNQRVLRRGSAEFSWAGRPGVESIYAIAISDAKVARDLVRHAYGLPDDCGATASERVLAKNRRAWLAQLDTLINRHEPNIDWQAVRIRHALP